MLLEVATGAVRELFEGVAEVDVFLRLWLHAGVSECKVRLGKASDGGLKLIAPGFPVYVAGEVGPVITYSEAEVFGVTVDDDETNLGWGAGVGTMAGPLDLRVSFHVWDADNMNETMTVGLSVGMSVWSF